MEIKNEITTEDATRIAFITYNRIGNGQYSNGVFKSGNVELYIAQNGHKAKWGVNSNDGNRGDIIRKRAYVAKEMVEEVNLEEMTHTYLYVGTDGAEQVLALTKDIDKDKITYVMCDCNKGGKMKMLETLGNTDARIIDCECGGRNTLERILKEYF